MPLRFILTAIIILGAITLWVNQPPSLPDYSIPQSDESITRGEYLVHAAGCISCHLAPDGGEALSGGQALLSPFGTFYAPNITPDPATGIGNWTGTDFIGALKHGRNPDGGFYYPALPYRSYQGMTDEDVLAVAAYLMQQEPVTATAPTHELRPWLGRWTLGFWNRLADLSEPDFPDYDDPQVERGAYLARNLGHCGECHTPRSGLGIPLYEREFSGAPLPEGEADDITREALGEWSEEDFAFFLFLGIKPDGEFVGGEMEPVIEHNTSTLTQEDREALAAFFLRRGNGPSE
ncbi:MAG: cytochrome c [Gammaproteobacteria bacterium]|nr:c-type cytochrome [Pseudomonadales bacterium]MCP5348100.1 c-type cytochrome [Pseudomonadales bacterium]